MDSPSRMENMFSVKRRDFIHQLDLIEKHQIPVISLQEAIAGNVAEPLSVVFTFDDGNESDSALSAKILNAYKFKGTFFPTITNLEKGIITEANLKQIIDYGMDIGSHGINHRNFKELSRHEQFIELNNSKRELEKITGQAVSFFSLPYGLYNRQTIGVAREAGYQGILTTQFRINRNVDKQFVLHRWSIKNSTSLKEFEKVVTQNKLFTFQKTLSGKFKTGLRNVVGLNTANTLSEGIARISAAPTKG